MKATFSALASLVLAASSVSARTVFSVRALCVDGFRAILQSSDQSCIGRPNRRRRARPQCRRPGAFLQRGKPWHQFDHRERSTHYEHMNIHSTAGYGHNLGRPHLQHELHPARVRRRRLRSGRWCGRSRVTPHVRGLRRARPI